MFLPKDFEMSASQQTLYSGLKISHYLNEIGA